MKRKENFKLPPGWPVRDGTKTRLGKLGLVIALFLFLAMSVVVWAVDKPVQKAAKESLALDSAASLPAAKAQVPYELDWYSFNSGGASYGTSATRHLGYSIGQSVAGFGTSGSNQLGTGFWHGGCVNIRGDMNGDAIHTSPDVVLMLNCVFLGTGNCEICFADLSCDGSLTSSDVVLLLNLVFLGTPPPC